MTTSIMQQFTTLHQIQTYLLDVPSSNFCLLMGKFKGVLMKESSSNPTAVIILKTNNNSLN